MQLTTRAWYRAERAGDPLNWNAWRPRWPACLCAMIRPNPTSFRVMAAFVFRYG